MQHQVTATDVLHHEIHPGFRLKACVKIEQERVALFIGDQEDSLLRLRTFDLVILNDEFLLQYFDGVKLFGSFSFRKHDLAKVSFAQDSEEIEMFEANSLSYLLMCWLFCRLMLLLLGFGQCLRWLRRM